MATSRIPRVTMDSATLKGFLSEELNTWLKHHRVHGIIIRYSSSPYQDILINCDEYWLYIDAIGRHVIHSSDIIKHLLQSQVINEVMFVQKAV